ncbi:MAG: SAM-dependent methyltransferase, partial [Cytophagaceae bacterium]
MPWYHDFFHGLPQIAWKAAQTDEQTQLDLELIVDTLDFGPGDRLLDVFCGYGRHALPLARMGAHVTGVDI